MVDIAALWDFSDPVGSESRFRAELAGAGPAEARVLGTQLARALGLQGRFAEAHAVLDRLTDPDAGDPELVTRVALERGRLHRSAGDDDAARPHFQRAETTARAGGLDPLHIDALHMLALVQERAEAMATTERALASARASADPAARAWEASLLNNLGMVHADAGDWTEALATFEEALAVRRRAQDVESEQIARWMVAWTLRNLGRTREALTIQRALRAEHEVAGSDDPDVRAELALLEGGDTTTAPG